jgi:hypothetical protein
MPSGVYYIGQGLRGIALGPGWEKRTYFLLSHKSRFIFPVCAVLTWRQCIDSPYEVCRNEIAEVLRDNGLVAKN